MASGPRTVRAQVGRWGRVGESSVRGTKMPSVTVHVFVDETKRAGYVVAAVSVADPVGLRGVLRGLIAPGNRRLHMHNERPQRRPTIVAAVAAADVKVTIYDAARRYRSERAARAACLTALVADLSERTEAVRLVLDQDETLVHSDRQVLYLAARATKCSERLQYGHLRAHAEPLLALPDLVAWCWVRSAQWRRRIDPILTEVRTV